jgi:hypothetical protein
VTEYHVRQFDGPPHTCDGKNCACATGAMDIAYGTAGDPLLTADQVRTQSGVSCVPGAHSPSGGLFVSDIERVCRENGVSIDFGRDPGHPQPRRWSWLEGVQRLEAGMWMHVLGDYDQMGPYSAQPGFKGDHSSGVHIPAGQKADTCCFHDPLRGKPIDLPMARLNLYWQKPGAAIRGLAGWVHIKEEPVLKVTMTGKPGSISIIPNPKNRYYDLATGTFLPKTGTYSFTSKDPATPCKTPPVNGITEWYLVGADLALIPKHNAVFTPTPPPADCSAQDAALAQIHTLSA